MNPLELLRQMQADNRQEFADRQVQQQQAAARRKLKAAEFIGLDADTGTGIFRQGEGVKSGQIITSGSIKAGQLVKVDQAEQTTLINQMPAAKRQKKAEEVKPSFQLIKYLYSIVSNAERKFYVGGWTSNENTLVHTLPASAIIHHASVDNLGGEDWVVNLHYSTAQNSPRVVQYLSSSQEGWERETPYMMQCYGHGFWKGESPRSMISNDTTITYVEREPGIIDATLVVYVENFSSAELYVVFNDKVKTYSIPGFTYRNINDVNDETPLFPQRGILTLERSWVVTDIFAPGDLELENPITLEIDKSFRSLGGTNYGSGLVYPGYPYGPLIDEAGTEYFAFRINASGEVGIGYSYRRGLITNSSTTPPEYQFVAYQVEIVKKPQTFDEIEPLLAASQRGLDVQEEGFSIIPFDAYSIYQNGDPKEFEDQNVSIQLFDLEYEEQGTAETLMHKPNFPDDEFTNYFFYNASYHP